MTLSAGLSVSVAYISTRMVILDMHGGFAAIEGIPGHLRNASIAASRSPGKA